MRVICLSLVASCLFSSIARSDDWPGWRGPNRDGISNEKGIMDRWPANGPVLKWSLQGMGAGYSTPAVADGKLYLIGAEGGKENLICVDLSDKKVAWSVPIGKRASVGYEGSRATPTVDGNMIYALSSNGELSAIELKDQKVVWEKSYKNDFGGRYGAWGFAESPLVDGNKLVIGPGGPKAAIVALDKKNGEVLWQSTVPNSPVAAYASPIAIDVAGERQYVHFLSAGVVGVDAKTGKHRWTYDKCSNGTANCPTPIYSKGQLFAASGYGTGGGSVTLSKNGAREKYFVKKFVNHHGGFVKIGNYVYGTNDSSLLCVDWNTGAVRWQDRSVGKGSIAAVDGKLIVRSESGPIALVEANPGKYTELGRIKNQPERSGQAAWAHPVIADKTLYIRDWETLLAYELGE